jgi:hypothetical protein
VPDVAAVSTAVPNTGAGTGSLGTALILMFLGGIALWAPRPVRSGSARRR